MLTELEELNRIAAMTVGPEPEAAEAFFPSLPQRHGTTRRMSWWSEAAEQAWLLLAGPRTWAAR